MDFSLTTLYVLPNGNLAPDNFKRENLQPTQFGIFNSRYKAVTNATDAKKSPYIQFGQGRIEKVPGLTSKYSDKISSGSVIEWTKASGSSTNKNQITYAGYDGIDSRKTLKANCDEQYSLTVRARSTYIDAAFAYGLTRTVTVTTPCCADCGDNCETIDPRWLAIEFAKKINAEPMLKNYVVATPVFYCDPAADPETTIATVTYSVSLCDNGDAMGLAYVQSQYPDDIVEFDSRNGSISTYKLTRLATAGAPASLVVTLPVALAVCDVCPATYSLQSAAKQFIVETPLDGSEDLSTANARQTFANTIKAVYQAAATFNGATAVDPATNQITIPSHGLVVNQPVVYSNGGGTTIVGMTNGATYYVKTVVDANNVTLSTTPGGTVVDITADGVGASQTLTRSSSAVFLENKGGSATILITIDATDEDLVAVAADIVTPVGPVEALCVPPAGTTAAWSAVDTGYKIQRVMELTITDDCDTDLAEIQAHYPDYTVTLVLSANCNSKYRLTQTSDTIQADCGFGVPPSFAPVQDYKGIAWVENPAVLQTGLTCSAGVKIEGLPLDKFGKVCDPHAFPHEFDRLTFEVFSYKGATTSQDFITFDRCDNVPITTTQKATYITGTGDEIFEMEKAYNSYQTTFKHIFHDTNFNGAFVRYSDPNKFYDLYMITFKSPDLNTWDNVSRQDETVLIAVPAGTGATLEAFLLGYFGPEKFTAGVLLNV